MRYLPLLAFATASLAQIPLADLRFTYPDIPYQVGGTGVRGPQVGYNICNSTTEGPASLCQTSFVNSIEDFCLWAPPAGPALVGDTEGEMVAWCTRPGKGARTIPAGALLGVQFTRTPNYVQVVGFVNQTQLNIIDGDTGGELDPHGADQRGNPLGGLLFSTAFNGTGGNGTSQVIEWTQFIGGSRFCLKACDPSYADGPKMCQHIYDRLGCDYNAPASYAAINGTFESCQGDPQRFPGEYGQDGTTTTYSQPPESLGPITTVPYTAVIPASSSCTPFSSAAIFATLTAAPVTSTPTATSRSPATALAPLSSAPSSRASSLRSAAGTQTSSSMIPSPTASSSGAGTTRVGILLALGVAALALVW